MLKNRKICAILFFMIVFGLIACRSSNELPDNVFAVVNGDDITLDEFIYTYNQQIRMMKDPFDQDRMNYHGGKMIQSLLFSQSVKKKGNYDPLEYKEREKKRLRQAVIDAMVEKILLDTVQALPENDIRDAFLKSQEYREVRHLFTSDPNQINTWYNELMTGEASFHSLAPQAFQDTFLQKHGGYLGLITYGDMIPEFEETAFQTEIGEITKPFKTPFGWHILKVENIQRDVIPTEYDYQVNRDRIQKKIMRIQKEKILSSFYESLIKSHRVTLDPDGVNHFTYLILTYRNKEKDLMDDITGYPKAGFFDDILNRSDDIWNQPVLYYDNQILTLLDLLPLLESIPQGLIYGNPPQAILFAFRNEMVYRMGLDEGLDQSEKVRMQVHVHLKDWLSHQLVNQISDTLRITYPPGLSKDEQSILFRQTLNEIVHNTYLDLREKARIQTDMSKVYQYYENF
jgi:hypothetical protein